MTDVIYDAVISECGEYRYSLTRTWDERKRPLTFIMLNPSTADGYQDDPTIRRCMGFAEREQAGGIVVVNLYGLRATNPLDLWKHPDPIGAGNDRAILRAVKDAGGAIVCAWGGNAPMGRANYVRHQLINNAQLLCLGKTKFGEPKHPLYLRKDQPLERLQ